MEERKPKVSVIMPCYNHEEYVAEAIESVLAQTFQDFEFIICNNGSTDSCGEIINRYSDRVKIITLEKNDGRKCHELLYEAAKGEFLAWIASDDYWYPDKLKEQLRAIEQHPEYNIFFTWSEVVDKDLREVLDNKRFAQKNKSRYEWIREMILHATLIEASSIMIRNDGRYIKYQDDVERFRQYTDLKTYLNMLLEEDIYMVEKFLVKHRMNGKNLSVPSAENQIRTVNELGYILYEIWGRLSDEEFGRVFSGPDFQVESKEDTMCQRILYYIEISKKLHGCGSNALTYVWEHYFDKGVSELLADKYGFTKQDLYQFSAEVGEGKYWYDNLEKEKKIAACFEVWDGVSDMNQKLKGMFGLNG